MVYMSESLTGQRAPRPRGVIVLSKTEVREVPLQEWMDTHEPDSKMFWRDDYYLQITFIRDQIPGILAEGRRDGIGRIRDNIRVISAHRSKSILLPVYQITAPNGTVFTLRNNFYEWKVSVESPVDIWAPFDGLFNQSSVHDGVYCEGIPNHKVFGSYAGSQKQFTVELPNNYALWTFFWIYSRQRQGRHD